MHLGISYRMPRTYHDTGISAVLFNNTANTAALVKNASSVANAQPIIPYFGIRSMLPTMFTAAAAMAAAIGIHVVDEAFDSAE